MNYQQLDRLFWNLLLNFWLSLLEGSLGAVVLYFAFSSGILTSAVFPSIPNLAKGLAPRAADLNHVLLTELTLWSIVAGFSERVSE